LCYSEKKYNGKHINPKGTNVSLKSSKGKKRVNELMNTPYSKQQAVAVSRMKLTQYMSPERRTNHQLLKLDTINHDHGTMH
jgi:replication fork clamp-binding protein CrfC